MDTEKQKQTISLLYILLIIGTILGFVPEQVSQMLSLVLFLTVLIGAYYYRFRDKEDGLLYNHMTYLIGTIWIGTTFLLVGVIAAATWIYLKGDHSLITGFVDSINNGVIPTEDSIKALMGQYMSMNRQVLVLSTLTTVAPAMLYLVYRIGNGFSRGVKGYRIANPKSWL